MFFNSKKNKEEKELNSFIEEVGLNKKVVNEPKNLKEETQNSQVKASMENKLKQVYSILTKQDYVQEQDMEYLEQIIADFHNQRPAKDGSIAARIDVLIKDCLDMIETQSNRHGYLSVITYLNRLEELISERKRTSDKYLDNNFIKMDLKRFKLSVDLNIALNNKDRLEKTMVDMKKQYEHYKELGKVVEARRIATNAKLTREQVDNLVPEIELLERKINIAHRFCSMLALKSHSENQNDFTDEEVDFLSDVCNDNVYDEKRLEQCEKILNKHKMPGETGGFVNREKTSALSEDEEEAIFGGF